MKTLTEEHKRNISLGLKKVSSKLCYWKGKTHTEEYKQKMRESKKGSRNAGSFIAGQPNGRAGQHHSEETKQKIREKRKLQVFSKETREKLSNSRKGHIFSEETRAKISKAHTGRINGPHTLEHRLKISAKLKGANGPGWKGGITEESRRIRTSIELRLWREAVFARDGWTCKCCTKTGCELAGHHILNFSSHPDLRTAIDNGVTLCTKCHRSFHKIYGRHNNTVLQLEEFIEQQVVKS